MPAPKQVTTLEEAVEAGYLGTVPDETPNEDYTVAGVIAKAPKAAPVKAITRDKVADKPTAKKA